MNTSRLSRGERALMRALPVAGHISDLYEHFGASFIGGSDAKKSRRGTEGEAVKIFKAKYELQQLLKVMGKTEVELTETNVRAYFAKAVVKKIPTVCEVDNQEVLTTYHEVERLVRVGAKDNRFVKALKNSPLRWWGEQLGKKLPPQPIYETVKEKLAFNQYLFTGILSQFVLVDSQGE